MAYVIFNYKILDWAQIGKLSQLEDSILEKFGGEVIVGSPAKVLEGIAMSHMVILKFEDVAAAEKWYYSPENEEFSKLRRKITEGSAVIVPGTVETEAFVRSHCRASA